MPKFYYVEFHAEGGVACASGLRRFEEKDKADSFTALLMDEPEHTCKNSVRQFESDKCYPEVGMIAAGGRRTGKDYWRRMLTFTTNGPRT